MQLVRGRRTTDAATHRAMTRDFHFSVPGERRDRAKARRDALSILADSRERQRDHFFFPIRRDPMTPRREDFPAGCREKSHRRSLERSEEHHVTTLSICNFFPTLDSSTSIPLYVDSTCVSKSRAAQTRRSRFRRYGKVTTGSAKVRATTRDVLTSRISAIESAPPTFVSRHWSGKPIGFAFT